MGSPRLSSNNLKSITDDFSSVKEAILSPEPANSIAPGRALQSPDDGKFSAFKIDPANVSQSNRVERINEPEASQVELNLVKKQ